MIQLLKVFLLLYTLVIVSSAEGNLFCYFPSWTIYNEGHGKFEVDNLDSHLCTHILYAFVGLNEDGTLDVLDDWELNGLNEMNKLSKLKNKNKELKILVSMGGWNEGSTKYSNVAKNPEKRLNLVNSVIQFIHKYNLDGFDLDWEYPSQRGGSHADKKHFVNLLKELKTALKSKGKLLTAAVSANPTLKSYDVVGMSKYLDFINIMTYDIHGSFDGVVGHNAPLYASHLDTDKKHNVAAYINAWLKRGANPKQINMGLATYGRSFTLQSSKNNQLNAPINGPGQQGPYTQEEGLLGYNEICELYNNWNEVWDDEQKVPHRYSGDQWVGYDNVRSIKLKVEYAKKMKLGGAMVWSLDTDDFNGYCGHGKYPLVNTIKTALGN